MKDQLQNIKDGFKVSNHRFLNKLADGISAKIKQRIPNLELRYTGKSVKGDIITAVVIGETYFAEADDVSEASKAVGIIMQELKNPSTLIGVVEK